MADEQPQNARQEYRQRIQQRQTVVFGSISAVLIVLLLVSLLFWTGLVPFPFDREFTQPTTEAQQIPCPATSSAPLKPETITARVYNSSATGGLASDTSTKLSEAGVTISETANWSGESLDPAVTIYTGTNGVSSAYTLRAFFPDATITFDPTNQSAVVDVVIGSNWEGMKTDPTADDFTAAMEPLENCTAVEGL